MSRIQERIPRERFQEIFRPMIRSLGTKNVIIKLNEVARTAIPRQVTLDQFMPKLELLCFEQKRARVDEAIEQLWEIYLDNRLGEALEQFHQLSDELNKGLDGESLPKEPEKRESVKKTIQKIVALLEESELTAGEVEAVFRVKAYPEVLQFYLEIMGLK